MFSALRRYVAWTSVLQLTAVVAIAEAVFGFVAYLTYGFVITPILTPVPHPAQSSLFGSTSYPGRFALAGRLFDWADPAGRSLALAALAGLAYLLARRQRTPTTVCPHCLARVLPAAMVCFNCTRDLGARPTTILG
ncbi:MAG: hypothetical protein ACXVRS_12840 [Gaiellaceae bacterium]